MLGFGRQNKVLPIVFTSSTLTEYIFESKSKNACLAEGDSAETEI